MYNRTYNNKYGSTTTATRAISPNKKNRITPAYTHLRTIHTGNENIYKSIFDKSLDLNKTAPPSVIKSTSPEKVNDIGYKTTLAPISKKLSPKKAKRQSFDSIYPFGVNANQGHRPYMEDRYLVTSNFTESYKSTIYAVFDGHGGTHTAQFCTDNCARLLYSNSKFPNNPDLALKETFNTMDRMFCNTPIAQRLDCGSCAIVACVINDTIYVANVGDSRCIIVKNTGSNMNYNNGNNNTMPLSSDHKANKPDERRRIQRLGGTVIMGIVPRVMGQLAVARAIGDKSLKPYVTSDPEIMTYNKQENDLFMVLASDGVWDVLSNADVGKIIKTMLSSVYIIYISKIIIIMFIESNL